MAKRKNHSPHCPIVVCPCKPREGDFTAKVSFEAIREEMTMAELSKKYGVHLLPAGVCKKTPRGNPDRDVETRGD